MITGAHIMLQSRDEKADKAFLTEVLKLSSVDAGDGFLLFGVPPSEIAVHGSETNDVHQLYFMCKDIGAFVADMKQRNVPATEPENKGWGTLTEITLPGGGKIGVYQPHHPRPKQPGRRKAVVKAARKMMKKQNAKKKGARKKAKARKGKSKGKAAD